MFAHDANHFTKCALEDVMEIMENGIDLESRKNRAKLNSLARKANSLSLSRDMSFRKDKKLLEGNTRTRRAKVNKIISGCERMFPEIRVQYKIRIEMTMQSEQLTNLEEGVIEKCFLQLSRTIN